MKQKKSTFTLRLEKVVAREIENKRMHNMINNLQKLKHSLERTQYRITNDLEMLDSIETKISLYYDRVSEEKSKALMDELNPRKKQSVARMAELDHPEKQSVERMAELDHPEKQSLDDDGDVFAQIEENNK